jgi:hypothetical protein
MAFGDEGADLLDQTSNPNGTLRLTLDDQLVPLRRQTNVEQGLEMSEIFVVCPEERFDRRLGNGYLPRLNWWDSCISLTYSDLTETMVAKDPPVRKRGPVGFPLQRSSTLAN